MRLHDTKEILVPLTPDTYCYDEISKHRLQLKVRDFYRRALKLLPDFERAEPLRFNPGGVAVWGEVRLRLRRKSDGVPVVEAYNVGFPMTMQNREARTIARPGTGRLLVRQWDGQHSGANHYVATLEEFINLVHTLALRPFKRT